MTAELMIRWSGGELDLMGENLIALSDGSTAPVTIEALADGTNWGNPQSVRRVLRSALLDGSRSVKERDDNRTIPLKLRLTAADGPALAAGESPLAMLDGLSCELVWTPPAQAGDPESPAAVFVAVSADLAHDMDDFAENRYQRFYTLTLDCLPHVYSDEYVTIPAVAQGSSTPTLSTYALSSALVSTSSNGRNCIHT